jgi:hypothetical protein
MSDLAWQKKDSLSFRRLKLVPACVIVNRRKSLKIGVQKNKPFLRETKRYRARMSIQQFAIDVSGTTTTSGKILNNVAPGTALQECGAGVIFDS